MNKSKVIIYSTSWCAFCKAAKEYLDKLGVKYSEIDVENNPQAGKEAIEKSGQTGVPVLDIDGTIVLGFDRPKIDLALKNASLV